VTRRRLIVGALLLGVAAYATRIALWKPLAVVGSPPDDGYVRVPGVVHVHTTFSDGGGSPAEVIAAARAAGLSFVAITDHNTLDAKNEQGWRASKKTGGLDGSVLAIVGVEASTNAGHVVGLGIADPDFRFSGDVRDALEDIRDLGGAAFAAHPLTPKSELLWTGWDEPGAWGIELLNGDSQWRAAGWLRLLRTSTLYALNHRYALLTSLTAPNAVLARWDELLRDRDVAGIAGADAHSRVPVTKKKSLRFPSYEALFDLARNYVLLDAPLSGADGEADEHAIVAALGRGRSYVGVDALAPAGGFFFVAERGAQRWTMGDTVPNGPGLTLRAGGLMPSGARVRLLRDGEKLAESTGSLLHPSAEVGVYRVEVRLPGWDIPWVLSNPIVVADEATAASRRKRAAWPVETPAPAPVAAIPLAGFHAEGDPTSRAERAIDSGEGLRLRFRLAPPSPTQRDTFCALVDRTPPVLVGRHGITVKIKADGVYRVWVQVRDTNPASADGGTEWWTASIKTSTEWRRLAIPFSRFRSINPNTDGKLDLDQVQALVFVIDRGSVKPGTEGTLSISDLSAY
jgi:hypothetical protein